MRQKLDALHIGDASLQGFGSPDEVAAMSLVLLARHRDNIGKLLRGEESRIGEKKAAASVN